jgi:hypothetical protein
MRRRISDQIKSKSKKFFDRWKKNENLTVGKKKFSFFPQEKRAKNNRNFMAAESKVGMMRVKVVRVLGFVQCGRGTGCWARRELCVIRMSSCLCSRRGATSDVGETDGGDKGQLES